MSESKQYTKYYIIDLQNEIRTKHKKTSVVQELQKYTF